MRAQPPRAVAGDGEPLRGVASELPPPPHPPRKLPRRGASLPRGTHLSGPGCVLPAPAAAALPGEVPRGAAARGAWLLPEAAATIVEAGGDCGVEGPELPGAGRREAPHLELPRRRRDAGHWVGAREGLRGLSGALLRLDPYKFLWAAHTLFGLNEEASHIFWPSSISQLL